MLSLRVICTTKVILCGDFLQLPPVRAKKMCFEGTFNIIMCWMAYVCLHIYTAECWPRVVEKCIQLKKVFRQSDLAFVELLSEIRVGKIPQKFYLLTERIFVGRSLATYRHQDDVGEGEHSGFFGFDEETGTLVVGKKEEEEEVVMDGGGVGVANEGDTDESSSKEEDIKGKQKSKPTSGDNVPTILLPTRKEVARYNASCLNALKGKLVYTLFHSLFAFIFDVIFFFFFYISNFTFSVSIRSKG